MNPSPNEKVVSGKPCIQIVLIFHIILQNEIKLWRVFENLNVIDEIISFCLIFYVLAFYEKGLFVKIGCFKAVKNWENHHDEIKWLNVFE